MIQNRDGQAVPAGVCFDFYLKGFCKKGDMCKYRHERAGDATERPVYNKNGAGPTMQINKKRKKLNTQKVPANELKKGRGQVLECYQSTDVSHVVKVSDIFKDLEFFVMNTDDSIATKAQLETLIAANGGKFTQAW